MAYSTVYHVTPTENIPSILSQGILPKVGERSKSLGESTPAIYLFSSIEDASDALSNWLGDAFEDSESLSVLTINAENLHLENSTAGFEVLCFSPIESDRIIQIIDENDLIDRDSDFFKREEIQKLKIKTI